MFCSVMPVSCRGVDEYDDDTEHGEHDAFVRTYDLILKNILRVQAGEAPESCVRI